MKRKDPLLEAALAVAKGDVRRLTFDPMDAKKKCHTALNKLERYRAELARGHRGLDLKQFDALPELCMRTFEQQRIAADRSPESAGQLAAKSPAAFAWRRDLMAVGSALVARGLVDAQQFERIGRGRGLDDNLRDVIDLAELLTPHRKRVEAFLSRGALEAAQQAAETALDLMGGSRGRSIRSSDAAELRDRYAALVSQRYDLLRGVFAVLVGYREAGEITRPLGHSGR